MNENTVAGAIDVGGTKITIGIVDSEGRVLARADTPTAPERGYRAAMERMTAELQCLLTRCGRAIEGIGVGSTGPINRETGVYGEVGTLPGWEGSPLGSDLKRAFNVPVSVENDADAAALAEAAWGAGRGSTTLLYVTVSTGIGVGIILHGNLYYGAGGAHPEIGHQVIDANGPLCYCGANGCWESLASGPAMEKWMAAKIGEHLTAHRICEMARHGDPLAKQAVEREASYLGLGLANLVTMFCPEKIVLGGGMMQSADLFLPGAIAVVRRICTQVPAENTSIVVAGLGKDTGLLGAACAWYRRTNNRDR